MTDRLLRQTESFRATETPGGRVKIVCLDKKASPRQRTISGETWAEMARYNTASFDGTCVLDLGIGAFQKSR